MATKDQHIKLIVKTLKREVLDYWTVVFDRPPGFIFEAGDWIDIEFDQGPLKGGKTYSISSSPTEADIQITFRAGLSELKRALKDVRPGEELYISQYGNDYDFQLNRNRSSVLVAGGVGIAPFRSMLKEMADDHDTNDVSLIYLNQNENFLFSSELDVWSTHLPNLSITYINTKDINRKKREKLIHSLIGDIGQNFYISGPPAMVEANEHLLIDMGVQIRNIRIDSFGGY
ncbi:FAD-dependent oxidoreductase [Candidatus Saccharibacteria bacterium]|nr:FAD-dependent oxidoreductase [Candidatus Saccharibacteria bacterium]MBH1972455.1 FAD-dependent oxidoreductase [Candidatus Saccharibacteria bacterium]MBH1990203.1 FAD-dependent oxidoreductase [Candidatus Saccharibacteria bacterium]